LSKSTSLAEMIHKSVTIDCTQRESVHAEIRLKVKKILRKYGYPPDKQEKATQTVLAQAELIAKVEPYLTYLDVTALEAKGERYIITILI
jgi:hypothetical protein